VGCSIGVHGQWLTGEGGLGQAMSLAKCLYDLRIVDLGESQVCGILEEHKSGDQIGCFHVDIPRKWEWWLNDLKVAFHGSNGLPWRSSHVLDTEFGKIRLLIAEKRMETNRNSFIGIDAPAIQGNREKSVRIEFIEIINSEPLGIGALGHDDHGA
jgi:hypothetical protein